MRLTRSDTSAMRARRSGHSRVSSAPSPRCCGCACRRPDGLSHIFLKIYKPRPAVASERPMDMSQMVEGEFAATLRLHTALAERPGLAAPRPIAVFPQHLAILTEEVVGTPFDRVLRAEGWRLRPSPMLGAIAARIGAWIREYQRVVAASGVLSLADQREYSRRAASAHHAAHPDRGRSRAGARPVRHSRGRRLARGSAARRDPRGPLPREYPRDCRAAASACLTSPWCSRDRSITTWPICSCTSSG